VDTEQKMGQVGRIYLIETVCFTPDLPKNQDFVSTPCRYKSPVGGESHGSDSFPVLHERSKLAMGREIPKAGLASETAATQNLACRRKATAVMASLPI
jgi:hypothetical protein